MEEAVDEAEDDRALPPGADGPGVDAQLREMARLAASLTQEEWWRQPESALLPVLAALDQITASLDAARLQLVGQVEEREVHGQYPVPGTAALLRTVLRWRPAEAARMRRLAREVPGGCEGALTALAEGEISLDHARVIHDVVGRIPPAASEADRMQAVHVLLDAARQFDPSDLARIGRHVLAHLDPDGPEPDEEKAQRRREFGWRQLDDGSIRLHGRLDPEAAATLIRVLDPLSAPHPASEEEGNDMRTPGQRRADALTDLARLSLDSGTLPTEGGERPHLTVTVPLDTLRREAQGVGGLAAHLDDIGPISAETARRLACDSQVVPAVLGSTSQPLDVGRASRTVPTPMRRALVARDLGCAFPGCDRPPGWCDAHHIQHWADGGATALSNLVLLCGHHHRRVHKERWSVRVGAHGHPEFRPPDHHPSLLRVGGPRPDTWWRNTRRH